VRIQPNFLGRISQYIKALGKTGQLLTLLGLLPTLADILAPLIGFDIQIPSLVSVLWFICAFSFANLKVFEAQTNSNLEIQIEEYHPALKKWYVWEKGHLLLNPEIALDLHAQVNIYNHSDKPTHVRLFVASIDSEWIPAKKLSDFVVRVNRTNSQGLNKSDNPFILDSGEINDKVNIRAELFFQASNLENEFRYLGSLSQLVVTLGAEQAGNKISFLSFNCDVGKIHQTIEEQIVTQVQNNRNNDNLPRQFLEIMKQYWGVSSEKEQL